MKNGKKKTNLCQTLLNLSDLLDLSFGYIQHNKGQNDYDTLSQPKSQFLLEQITELKRTLKRVFI